MLLSSSVTASSAAAVTFAISSSNENDPVLFEFLSSRSIVTVYTLISSAVAARLSENFFNASSYCRRSEGTATEMLTSYSTADVSSF